MTYWRILTADKKTKFKFGLSTQKYLGMHIKIICITLKINFLSGRVINLKNYYNRNEIFSYKFHPNPFTITGPLCVAVRVQVAVSFPLFHNNYNNNTVAETLWNFPGCFCWHVFSLTDLVMIYAVPYKGYGVGLSTTYTILYAPLFWYYAILVALNTVYVSVYVLITCWRCHSQCAVRQSGSLRGLCEGFPRILTVQSEIGVAYPLTGNEMQPVAGQINSKLAEKAAKMQVT